MKDAKARRSSARALAVMQALAAQSVPIAIGPPQIQGETTVGADVLGVDGDYTSPPTSFTHAWYRGATLVASTRGYRLTAEDLGQPVKYVQTPTNAKGPGAPNSSPSFVVTDPFAANRPPVYPSANWTGVAGSGIGAAPSDPARTTAKAALRLLVPPGQRFAADLLLGVTGGTHNQGSLVNRGIAKVRVHCEGTIVDIAAPSVESFQDANGIIRSHEGWWCTLKHGQFAQSGDANVYFEAIPLDPTMQSRVIGPFAFHRDTVLHDADVTVAPSQPAVAGATYPSIAAALAYFRGTARQNPRITITEPGLYALGNPGGSYSGKGYCTIRANVPATIGFASYTTDAAATMRSGYDGLKLQGANLTIDYANVAEIYNEGLKDHWLDGCNETSSRGRDGAQALWRKGTRPIAWNVRGKPWRTEVKATNVVNPFINGSLNRNVIADKVLADIVTDARCTDGLEVRDARADWWTNEIDALDVRYTGPGSVGTLALLDAAKPYLAAGNMQTTIARLTTDAGSVDFSISFAEGAQATGNYTVQDLANWINSQAGWTATILDNTRCAAALSRRGFKGTGFLAVDARTAPVRLVTMFDLHADLLQINVAGLENLVLQNVRCTNFAVQALFLTGGGGCQDFFIANIAGATDAAYDGSVFSQFVGAHSGVVVVNVSLTQTLWIRNGYADGGYNAILNCCLRSLGVDTPGDIGVRVENNHFMSGAPISPRLSTASGNSFGGTRASLWIGADAGDFSPAGELLANLKASTLRRDLAGTLRLSVATAGAVATTIASQALAFAAAGLSASAADDGSLLLLLLDESLAAPATADGGAFLLLLQE